MDYKEDAVAFNDKPEVIYQIMPDRFARVGSEPINPSHYPDPCHHSAWEDQPSREWHGRQYFGGNLRGIIERLPWLTQLGVTALMLTPIFPAPTYHKYDATDFRSIDPALGTDADFDELLSSCHRVGIRVIMDIAVNHLSFTHPLFQKASHSGDAPERDFFRFDAEGSYDCWWGFRNMPEIDYDHEEARREFIDGPDSVIGHWVRRGIDGIRLDCANDLSPGVVAIIRRTARAINPDVYVMGEIFSYPAEWLSCLDGVMNYAYRSALDAVFEGKISTKVFGAFLSHFVRDAGMAGLSDSLAMTSSHDTPRMRNQYGNDQARLEQALLMQFTLPGIPMIWQGEEIGMEGGMDPLNRAAFPWEPEKHDQKSLERYRRLIALRKERRELHRGDLVDLSPFLPEGVIGYLRRLPLEPGSFSVVLMNATREHKRFTLFLPESHCYSAMTLADALSGATVRFDVGNATFDLGPGESRLYAPRPRESFPNYSFYKNSSVAAEARAAAAEGRTR